MTDKLNDHSPQGSRDDTKKRRRSPRARTRPQAETAPRGNEEDPRVEPGAVGGGSAPGRPASGSSRKAPRRASGKTRSAVPTREEYRQRRDGTRRVMVVRQREDLAEVAVLEDGRLVEHYAEQGSPSAVGNVYLGVVTSVLPSMEAAFVNIGASRNGILHADELSWGPTGLKGRARRIENALKPGDRVLVQVTKDSVAGKGPRLTCTVTLAGRYLVYVPEGPARGVTRKLPADERARLKALATLLEVGDGGFIVRTAASGVCEEDLRADARELAGQWGEVVTVGVKGDAPSLVLAQPSLVTRVVRDVFNEGFSELVVSAGSAWEEVSSYLSRHSPHLQDRARPWTAYEDSFDAHGITDQLAVALDRTVPLPSGGSLVIDRTEALTVIDVNTAKFTGRGGNHEETVTENNLEAAAEVARQLRLRDIGGIVIVDFIDMALERNRDLVMEKFGESLEADRSRTRLAEMTSLGLVQLTRKRTGAGMADTLTTVCTACAGRGYEVDPLLRRSAPAGVIPRPLIRRRSPRAAG